MTTVSVNTYTHSVVYVADNILKSIKDIIRLSGLDPTQFVGMWSTHLLAIKTWLGTGDLKSVWLEIYHPTTDELIFRWDLDIHYGWSGSDGQFWTDIDQLRYAISKAGLAPNQARYRLLVDTKDGAPSVAGWSSTTTRSTANMVRQSLGSTVEHSGLGARTSYLRRAS